MKINPVNPLKLSLGLRPTRSRNQPKRQGRVLPKERYGVSLLSFSVWRQLRGADGLELHHCLRERLRFPLLRREHRFLKPKGWETKVECPPTSEANLTDRTPKHPGRTKIRGV